MTKRINRKPHWLTDDEKALLGKRINAGYESNPIRRYASGWYFWNECWTDVFGPFKTSLDASKELDAYCIRDIGLLGDYLNSTIPIPIGVLKALLYYIRTAHASYEDEDAENHKKVGECSCSAGDDYRLVAEMIKQHGRRKT